MYVKLCGITDPAQVSELVRLGPDALGINLIPTSKRCVSLERAGLLVQTIRAENTSQRKRVECVAVIAAEQLPPELSPAGLGERVKALLGDPSSDCIGFDRIQLHASDPAGAWKTLGASAQIFLTAQIASAQDVTLAAAYPGTPLLVDAKVSGSMGGTGHSFDWSLVESLASSRDLLLAGGLDADKLPLAMAQVRPWGVDVASGIESGTPGVKDLAKCAAFVEAARVAAEK